MRKLALVLAVILAACSSGQTLPTEVAASFSETTNLPPTAAWYYDCYYTTCQFIDQSSDPDGYLTWSHWTFGDGSERWCEVAVTDVCAHPVIFYQRGGTYTVALTVYDNFMTPSATLSRSITVLDSSTPSTISLTATAVRGAGVELRWSGIATDSVGIYRNNGYIARDTNDGYYFDAFSYKGKIKYTYKVCELGRFDVCSPSVSVK